MEREDSHLFVRIKGLARLVEMALGLWLFAAAFLWVHPPVQAENMWILGLLVIAVSLVALAVPFVRFANTAVAGWLIASVFALPHMEPGGTLSNVLTALALLGASMIPTSFGPTVKQRPWL